jgi:hypothetical protein
MGRDAKKCMNINSTNQGLYHQDINPLYLQKICTPQWSIAQDELWAWISWRIRSLSWKEFTVWMWRPGGFLWWKKLEAKNLTLLSFQHTQYNFVAVKHPLKESSFHHTKTTAHCYLEWKLKTMTSPLIWSFRQGTVPSPIRLVLAAALGHTPAHA